MGLIPVESRQCTYSGANGTIQYFMCSAYEYCCGRSCCRSPTLTLYQLWYFWLSIILILLLCSGGGWWYRFKNRGEILSQPTTTSQGTNVLYCPSADRVFFPNFYKDYTFPQTAFSPTSTSYYRPADPAQRYQGHPTDTTSYQQQHVSSQTGHRTLNIPPGIQGAEGETTRSPHHFIPPPPYSEPPPSYESVIRNGKG